MYGQIVTLRIHPDYADILRPVYLAHARDSRTEPGCRRFELLQDRADPSTLIFYEVFDDEDALYAHYETAHFKRVVETVQSLPDGAILSKDKIHFEDLLQDVVHIPGHEDA